MPEDGKNVDIIDPISQYSAFIVRVRFVKYNLINMIFKFLSNNFNLGNNFGGWVGRIDTMV